MEGEVQSYDTEIQPQLRIVADGSNKDPEFRDCVMVVAAVPENAIAISCQPREVKTVDFMSPHQIYLDRSTDP